MWSLIIILISLPGLIVAQCDYDQKCWFAAVGCTMARGNPFERRAFISCAECMKLCLKRKDGPAPYCCKSIVYDSQWKFCDLFAVQANSKADFVQYPGRVYLSPSGNCTAAAIADCPDGQKPILSIFQNSTNPGISGGTKMNAGTFEQCGLLCAANKDDQGNPFVCKAASFSQGTCIISDKEAGPSTAQSLKPGADPNDVYYEKKCFPVDAVGPCSAILLNPHHVLVGFNRKTVDAASYDQCLQECLAAKQKYQFTCNSGQYYPDVHQENCILNEETSETKPDVFIATDDNNIYFQPECGSGKLIYSMKRARAKLYMRDVAIDMDKEVRWSDWSPCNPKTNTKHRYLNCYKERPTDCYKEEKPCDYVDPDQLDLIARNKSVICRPLLFKNKKLDCQYGVTDGTPRKYGCTPNTEECRGAVHYS